MKTSSVFHVPLPAPASTAAAAVGAVPASAVLLLSLLLLLLLLASSPGASAFRADDFGDDSSLPNDEGSGPDDEDLSYLFTDVMESDVTFRCYRCTGITEMSGCNLTSLHENPADYVTDCDGHCLNISTAESTVFDCTDNVPLRSAKCFQREDILMCICSTDLCNGPPLHPSPEDVIPLPSSRHRLNLTSSPEASPTFTSLAANPAAIDNVTAAESRPSVTVTSPAKSPAINLTSEQGIDLAAEGNMTSQQLANTTSPRDSVLSGHAPQPSPTMTSQGGRRNMTSPVKAGVVTSRQNGSGGGRHSVISPETFKQRHQLNGTVIEAASISKAHRLQPGHGCGGYCVVTWVVLLVTWRVWEPERGSACPQS